MLAFRGDNEALTTTKNWQIVQLHLEDRDTLI